MLDNCLREAAASGKGLFETWVKEALDFAARPEPDRARRDRLTQSAALLRSMAPGLAPKFASQLALGFAQKQGSSEQPPLAALRYDQLELMDEAQVDEKMEIARTLASIGLEVDAVLKRLNALMSALLGLDAVQPDRNPLRPDVYVVALQELFKQSGVAADVRVDWLQCMGPFMGRLLHSEYTRWVDEFKTAGVKSADYAVLMHQDASSSTPSRSASASHPPQLSRHNAGLEPSALDDSRLTVRQLRRLVMGEFDMRRNGDAGDPKLVPSSGDRRNRGNGFEHTIPAAMETLEELELVEDAMQRLAERKGTALRPIAPHAQGGAQDDDGYDPAAPELVQMDTPELYAYLRQESRSVGQVLGLEVVALMIENIVNNAQLLQPLRDIVGQLESPLLRLVMVDQRFFSDKQHPARRLLDAITTRSAGYDAADNPAFVAFLQPLRQAVQALAPVPIESAEPFELTLDLLTPLWDELQQRERAQHAQAVRTLLRVEQRNIEAKVVAKEVQAHPEAAEVPALVLEFASGPWAQVIAQARVLGKAAEEEQPGTAARLKMQASEYMALVDDVFWSVQPEVVGPDTDRLLRLIPGLLNKLRVGLKTIDYPHDLTSQFLDQLMALHQRSLQKNAPVARRSSWGELIDDDSDLDHLQEVAGKPDAVWLGPNETRTSGYLKDLGIDFPDLVAEAPAPVVAYNETARANSQYVALEANPDALPVKRHGLAASSPEAPALPHGAMVAMVMDPALNASDLHQGEWVNLMRGGSATRAQLIWVSPEQTMYMFTTSTGRNQSMSRGTLDRLIKQGNVQILVTSNVMDNALNAVTQTALRNSMSVNPVKPPAKPRG